jgi:CDP-glycerol glycerophosphotransferase (TagB/SpsB family)
MLELLAYPFPRSIWLYKLIRKLERYSVKTPKKITDLFELYKPCAVISTRPNHLEDYFYLFHASKLMVPTLGVIKSWDNVTTKGYMPVRCDKCTVWNDSMARSLSILHNYLVNDVVVTGAPQFDIYAEEINILRSVFFDSIGLNTKKKTVLYATSPPSINSDDPEILRDLSQALFEENIQIIARLHQMDDLERYVNISNPNLVFQVSGSGMCSVNTDARLCSKEFLNELRDTIYFSDLVVNTFSTITLDAVALNRPVININFDFKKKKYSNSVTRFNSFVHYQQIFSTGAAIQAKSFNELLNLIKNMSTISKISERERDQIKEELCYRVDGNSTQRLVEVIVEVAE